MKPTPSPAAVIAIAFALVGILPAYADDLPQPQVSFDLEAASNYIFRGVSQTENNPVVFGEATVKYAQFYANAGMENVDFHNGTSAEYDFSAGWTPKLAGFTFDLGAVRYGYIDTPAYIDTVEAKAAISHPIGPVTAGAAIFYTPNYFGTHEDGTYVEGTASFMVLARLSASGSVGHQYISAGHSYTNWTLGPGYAFNKHFSLDLRYYDTDAHALSKLYNSRVVASGRFSF